MELDSLNFQLLGSGILWPENRNDCFIQEVAGSLVPDYGSLNEKVKCRLLISLFSPHLLPQLLYVGVRVTLQEVQSKPSSVACASCGLLRTDSAVNILKADSHHTTFCVFTLIFAHHARAGRMKFDRT